MKSMSEARRQQLSDARLQKASRNPESCLFRVIFNNGKRGFIKDPNSAPLAEPAFIAGNPDAPCTPRTEILHCGGEPSDRDSTPYISCSADLFWCLWIAIVALLKDTTDYTEIYFIADGAEYDDTQTRVYNSNNWHMLDSVELVEKAKRRAIAASEVLVHREIGRERILGVMHFNLDVFQSTDRWICSVIQNKIDKYRKGHEMSIPYSHIAKIIFQDSRYQPHLLAEWCEGNMNSLKCLKRVQRWHCIVRQIYNGLVFKYGSILSREEFEEWLIGGEYDDARDYMQWHEGCHFDAIVESEIEEMEEKEWQQHLFWECMA